MNFTYNVFLVLPQHHHHSIILETDGAAIASRVSRPRTDTTDIILNEQTIMNACKYRNLAFLLLSIPNERSFLLLRSWTDSNLKDQMVRRIGQL